MEWSKEELETPMNEEAMSASKEGNFYLLGFIVLVTIGVLYYMI